MLAVGAMCCEYNASSVFDGWRIRVRRLQLLGNDAVGMRDAGRVEECNLDVRLELDVQQLQQFEFVLRTFGIQAHDFLRQAFRRPGHQRRGAKAATAGDQSLCIRFAVFPMLTQGMRHERQASLSG